MCNIYFEILPSHLASQNDIFRHPFIKLKLTGIVTLSTRLNGTGMAVEMLRNSEVEVKKIDKSRYNKKIRDAIFKII